MYQNAPVDVAESTFRTFFRGGGEKVTVYSLENTVGICSEILSFQFEKFCSSVLVA